jgi:hypothetical protein
MCELTGDTFTPSPLTEDAKARISYLGAPTQAQQPDAPLIDAQPPSALDPDRGVDTTLQLPPPYTSDADIVPVDTVLESLPEINDGPIDDAPLDACLDQLTDITATADQVTADPNSESAPTVDPAAASTVTVDSDTDKCSCLRYTRYTRYTRHSPTGDIRYIQSTVYPYAAYPYRMPV